MSAIAIFIPCAANALACPSATPLPPPVMNATLPASSFMTPPPKKCESSMASSPRHGSTESEIGVGARRHACLPAESVRMSDAAVRNSFIEQAGWCRKLGSPFTALLCETLAASLDAGTAIGREILDWPGDPRAAADALALRVAGALQ